MNSQILKTLLIVNYLNNNSNNHSNNFNNNNLNNNNLNNSNHNNNSSSRLQVTMNIKVLYEINLIKL